MDLRASPLNPSAALIITEHLPWAPSVLRFLLCFSNIILLQGGPERWRVLSGGHTAGEWLSCDFSPLRPQVFLLAPYVLLSLHFCFFWPHSCSQVASRTSALWKMEPSGKWLTGRHSQGNWLGMAPMLVYSLFWFWASANWGLSSTRIRQFSCLP